MPKQHTIDACAASPAGTAARERELAEVALDRNTTNCCSSSDSDSGAGGDSSVQARPELAHVAAAGPAAGAPLLLAYTREAAAGAGDAAAPKPDNTWRALNDLDTTNYIFKGHDAGRPARVEVYYFEQGAGDHLAAAGGGAERACERRARHAARAVRAALAPLPALALLLLAPPLELLLALQRSALAVAREAVTGCVQTWSDYLLKPALALAFNAALRPPLVLAANVARAAAAALRPAARALAELAEGPARVLAALRLVHVALHVAPPARAGHPAPADHPPPV